MIRKSILSKAIVPALVIIASIILLLPLYISRSNRNDSKQIENKPAVSKTGNDNENPTSTITEKQVEEENNIQNELTKDRPSIGDDNAPVNITVFASFQDSFYDKFINDTFYDLKSDYIDKGKVKYVFRNLPLSFQYNSELASLAAMCAYKQNAFWSFHDELIRNKKNWENLDNPMSEFNKYSNSTNLDSESFKKCYEDKETLNLIKEDIELAELLDIKGSPNFMINTKRILGAEPYSKFQEVIEKELID